MPGGRRLVADRDALAGERELHVLARLVDPPLDGGERDLQSIGDLGVRKPDHVPQQERRLQVDVEVLHGAPHGVDRLEPLEWRVKHFERRPRAVVDIDDAPHLEVVDAPFERLEAIDAVWRAVEGLNVDLKMALLLRDVVGLSYTEIADSLEVTLATVKWRIYKAREEVQIALVREGVSFGREEPATAEQL